jgi:uncharacterized coiled-coil protein SlyX
VTTPPEDSPPFVKVTLDVIYQKLLDVDQKVNPVPEIVKDHEARIRKLEIQTAIQWVGFGLLIAAVGGAGLDLLIP